MISFDVILTLVSPSYPNHKNIGDNYAAMQALNQQLF